MTAADWVGLGVLAAGVAGGGYLLVRGMGEGKGAGSGGARPPASPPAYAPPAPKPDGVGGALRGAAQAAEGISSLWNSIAPLFR